MNLNELAEKIHKLNHKWWHDPDGNRIQRNEGELLMLAISELSEALEGIRKNLMDDKLPHRPMEEVEMADSKIRLLDFSKGFGITIDDRDMHPSQMFIDDNKGAALLDICEMICRIRTGRSWLQVSIFMIDDYCKKFNLDLDGSVEEKLDYNVTRADHSHEQRALANGKKF